MYNKNIKYKASSTLVCTKNNMKHKKLTSTTLQIVFVEFNKFKSLLITKMGTISKEYILKNCSIVEQENKLIGKS